MLEDLNKLIDTLINLSRFSRRSADEKTSAINMASMELFKSIAGPIGTYSMGRPVATANFQETSLENSLLSSFDKTFQMADDGVSIGSTVSKWSFASEDLAKLYDVKLLEALYEVNGSFYVGVKCLPNNKIKQRIVSKIVPPSSDVPIGEYFGDNKFAVYPQPEEVIAKVLVWPTPCKIVYLPGTQTYDPAESIDLDWTEDAIYSLAIRAIKYLGLNIPNPAILQAAGVIQEKLV